MLFLKLVKCCRVEAEKGGRDHHGHHSGDVRRETSEEKPWKEWTPSYASQIPSNLNLEGFERPDLKHHDGFELKNPVPTTKGNLRVLIFP